MIGHNASEGIEPRNIRHRKRATGYFPWKPALRHALRWVCRNVPGS